MFLLPTAMGAAGIPAIQASYIVGIGAGLASLLLIGTLVRRVTTPADARAALILLQLMPVAFLFRIRANHEYPMLLCLVLCLVAIDDVRRSWWWAPVAAFAVTAAVLVKGVFVVMVLLAAGWWALVNPTRQRGSIARPIGAGLLTLVVVAVVAYAYDGFYVSATGDRFWSAYWQRQLGPLEIATPIDGASTLLDHAVFYAIRLAWHPGAVECGDRDCRMALWGDSEGLVAGGTGAGAPCAGVRDAVHDLVRGDPAALEPVRRAIRVRGYLHGGDRRRCDRVPRLELAPQPDPLVRRARAGVPGRTVVRPDDRAIDAWTVPAAHFLTPPIARAASSSRPRLPAALVGDEQHILRRLTRQQPSATQAPFGIANDGRVEGERGVPRRHAQRQPRRAESVERRRQHHRVGLVVFREERRGVVGRADVLHGAVHVVAEARQRIAAAVPPALSREARALNAAARAGTGFRRSTLGSAQPTKT